MAKFIINEDHTTELEVEARNYTLASDFFWFAAEDGETVLAYSASKVVSIRRKD
ncbi:MULTISPECIES: hypothetical protein [unclassified Microbacterium]|uniref:hypothetical protein n=1 Tax=unclassified Microbacterium TaxID=2609290 RepID=UPI0015E40107|nr:MULTISPECIES: hypothetical protein [unclassified Microbacterium]